MLTAPKIETAPGTFHYGDYNPNILGLALERVSAKSFEENFQNDIWNAIGAEYPALWSTDYHAFPLAESGLAAAPIDLAKIGIAMLSTADGDETHFMSKAWYERSTELIGQPQGQKFDGREWDYQNGWWLIKRPDGRADYAAIGHLGQYIYISPQNDVVFVRTGNDRNGVYDDDFTEIFYSAASQLGK